METARQYELLSEEEILQAKLDVQREVEPQIRELISRSESGLQGLQRRERSAHAKVRKTLHNTVAITSRNKLTFVLDVQAERSRASPAVLTLASAPKKQANSAYSAEVAKLRARLMALQTQKGELFHRLAVIARISAEYALPSENTLKAADKAEEELQSRKGSQ